MSELRIKITELFHGEKNGWTWELSRNQGGRLVKLAEGRRATPMGALYAVVMEARLYDPRFNAPMEQDDPGWWESNK